MNSLKSNVTNKIYKIAILAVGGQGGGVLSNWIVDTAENSGYWAQSTSVPGVAQRTGATIYYIELAEKGSAPPVFSLMPTKGDVDVVIASEIMEGGRAILRGFINPEKTVSIVSSHRIYAVSEKITPGDGRVNPEEIIDKIKNKSAKSVIEDFQMIADDYKSHISASLFGALAGSGSLPFEKDNFIKSIVDSGKGVSQSLLAFDEAFSIAKDAQHDAKSTPSVDEAKTAPNFNSLGKSVEILATNVNKLPVNAQWNIFNGFNKVINYQDKAYGEEYFLILNKVILKDNKSYKLTEEFAKRLANTMCYNDVIYVADIKTRSDRLNNIRPTKSDGTVVQITDYFHPTIDEVLSTLPTSISKFIENTTFLKKIFTNLTSKGRKIKVTTLTGFFQLYLLSLLKPVRRNLHRHKEEMMDINDWVEELLKIRSKSYDLAVLLTKSRRLHKGYSDTLSRGKSKYKLIKSYISNVDTFDRDTCETIENVLKFSLDNEKVEDLEEYLQQCG